MMRVIKHHYTIFKGREMKHGAVCPACEEGELHSCMCELICNNKVCKVSYDNHYGIEYEDDGKRLYVMGHA
jgi:uncharacterized protein (DUF983 family)